VRFDDEGFARQHGGGGHMQHFIGEEGMYSVLAKGGGEDFARGIEQPGRGAAVHVDGADDSRRGGHGPLWPRDNGATSITILPELSLATRCGLH